MADGTGVTPGTGGLTDQQLRAILGMSNLTAGEQALKQQQAIGDALRTGGPGGRARTDLGSQLGRGVVGIGQALGQYQLGQQRQALLNKLYPDAGAPTTPGANDAAGTLAANPGSLSSISDPVTSGMDPSAQSAVAGLAVDPNALNPPAMDPDTLRRLAQLTGSDGGS